VVGCRVRARAAWLMGVLLEMVYTMIFQQDVHQIEVGRVVLKAPPESVQHSGCEIAVSLSVHFFLS